MPHSKKKAAILTTATSLIAIAMTTISAGNTIEGVVLLVMSGALFALYEFFQVDEIPFETDDLETAAEVASDEINEQLEAHAEKSDENQDG